MIISQSFRSKQDDNTFGDEVFLSTNSDLVYFIDAQGKKTKSLTKRVEELNAEDIRLNNYISEQASNLQATINQEIIDRQAAVSTETSNREAAINQEILDRTEAIESLETTLLENISSLSATVDTNSAQIETIENSELPELEIAISDINALVGTLAEDETIEKTILERLADIEARLTLLEGGTALE